MVEEASYVTKEFLKKTDTVCKLISEIDPEYKLLDFIISHRVGKISQPGSFNHKTKQIIVHLADPSVKMRLMKVRKSLKKSKDFLLCKATSQDKKIEHIWTPNRKIMMKEENGTINEQIHPKSSILL